MDLSIIIVSYNARDDLRACLQSLHDAPPAASHQIIVVDNGSTDGSLAVVRQWPDVRAIDVRTNVGYAAANNVGIRASAGTNLLLLNSDTIVPRGAIDTLLRELDSHPDTAVVGPRLVGTDGRAELSFGSMLRHKVKAGLTGWAQVNGWRGNTSLEKRIEFDLYYIENWSLSLDFKIMWLTLLRGFHRVA